MSQKYNASQDQRARTQKALLSNDEQSPPHDTAFDKLKRDNENGSRQAILEDLFYDFHRSRVEVYKMNFIRGVFFGLGSVLGGTILVALTVWVLNAIGVLVPSLAGFIDSIVRLMSTR